MSSPIPHISAIHCIQTYIPASQTDELKNWRIENNDNISASPADSILLHPHFDPQTGVYTVPRDGIYLINMQLIPIGGTRLLIARQTRQRVNYAVHIQDPQFSDEYLDIGSHNLGEMVHLRAGTTVSCVRMVGAPGRECVRMGISCIQRKRKREQKKLSKREIKRRKKAARRAKRIYLRCGDDDQKESSDSEWDRGFESDSTVDELCSSPGILVDFQRASGP